MVFLFINLKYSNHRYYIVGKNVCFEKIFKQRDFNFFLLVLLKAIIEDDTKK